jgi:3'-phosphoadenosine 5'-phosphosulfate sulfotransferase (PAPS reductase)/FAD synthetase
MTLQYKQELEPKEIVNMAIKQYSLEKLYVLFSGGKDSVCVLHFIATNFPDKFAGAVFTNTGLGSQETRKFVIDYCKKMGWKLYLTYPQENERFQKIMLQNGFATPGSHRIWMGYLKYHAWYYFSKWRKKENEKMAFISGVRKKESRQRAKIKAYARKPVDVNATMVFVKPFLYKNGVELWDYFIENKLKKTPVYEWLNRSGECYCGAFTQPGDLKLMQKHDPFAFETIRRYEKLIQENGTDVAKKNCKWGEHNQATDDIINQTLLDSFIKTDEDYCGESCMVYGDDPKKFNDEFENIEAKLDKL